MAEVKISNKEVKILHSIIDTQYFCNNKKISIVNYLKIVHKGIIKFIDNYDMFGITKKNNQIYIKLMEDYLEEWEIIDEDLSNI